MQYGIVTNKHLKRKEGDSYLPRGNKSLIDAREAAASRRNAEDG